MRTSWDSSWRVGFSLGLELFLFCACVLVLVLVLGVWKRYGNVDGSAVSSLYELRTRGGGDVRTEDLHALTNNLKRRAKKEKGTSGRREDGGC